MKVNEIDSKVKLFSKDLRIGVQTPSSTTYNNDYQSLLTTQTTANTQRNVVNNGNSYLNHLAQLKKRNTITRGSSPGNNDRIVKKSCLTGTVINQRRDSLSSKNVDKYVVTGKDSFPYQNKKSETQGNFCSATKEIKVERENRITSLSKPKTLQQQVKASAKTLSSNNIRYVEPSSKDFGSLTTCQVTNNPTNLKLRLNTDNDVNSYKPTSKRMPARPVSAFKNTVQVKRKEDELIWKVNNFIGTGTGNVNGNSTNRNDPTPKKTFTLTNKNSDATIFENYRRVNFADGYNSNQSRPDTTTDTKRRPMSSINVKEKSSTTKLKDDQVNDLLFGRIDDYLIGNEIGKGSYAVVKQAIHKPTGNKYAIKVYEKAKINDPAKKGTVKREIQILKKLNNPFTIRLFEVIETTKFIFIVMEFVVGISLLAYLKTLPGRRIPESECSYVFKQITSGIAYLHRINIIHRDIKLENIIINTSNKSIKIIDYGFGCITSKSKLLNFFCGTPSYMPPEIVQKKDYIGFNADIWSLGILLYTLLCGAFPFKALTEKELYTKICKGVFTVPDYVSVEAASLLRKILILNPTFRINPEEIMGDTWFTKNNHNSYKF